MSDKKQLLTRYINYLKQKKFSRKKVTVYLFFGIVVITMFVSLKRFFNNLFSKKSLISLVAMLVVIMLFSYTFYVYSDVDVSNCSGIMDSAEIQQDLLSLGFNDLVTVSNITEVTVAYENSSSSTGTEVEGSTFIEGKNSYYIMVNRLMNCVTIYTYDEDGEYTIPVKAMVCSVGLNDETPLGVFTTSDSYEWRNMVDGSWAQYATRVYGSIMIHSVPYNTESADDLEWEQYNLLGEEASLGCVRLSVADAKWIYENCEAGTQVEIYESTDPGPLGKPESIEITDEYTWDPTDEDEDNPWNEFTPELIGVESKVVNIGEPINLLEGITAYDSCGNDVTDDIVVETDIDLSTIGKYDVTYTITDVLGRSATTTVSYYVIGDGGFSDSVEIVEAQ